MYVFIVSVWCVCDSTYRLQMLIYCLSKLHNCTFSLCLCLCSFVCVYTYVYMIMLTVRISMFVTVTFKDIASECFYCACQGSVHLLAHLCVCVLIYIEFKRVDDISWREAVCL